MSTLFLVNVPHYCAESDVVDWAKSCGVGVKSVRLIRDLVAGVSPSFAYVDISDDLDVAEAIQKLNKQYIGSRTILVSEARHTISLAKTA
jgi:RNA recognition motif-containing protein